MRGLIVLALILGLSATAHGQGYTPEVVKSCPDPTITTPICPTGAYTFTIADKNATFLCRNNSQCTFTFPTMPNGWFVTVGAQDTSSITLSSTASFDLSRINFTGGEKATLQADDTGNFLEFLGGGPAGPIGQMGPPGPPGDSITLSVTGGPPNPYVISISTTPTAPTPTPTPTPPPSPTAPTWVTPSGSLGSFHQGDSVSVQLQATDPNSPPLADSFALAAGSALPSGLSLSGAGLISGTMSSATSATINFTVVVSNSAGAVNQGFSITDLGPSSPPPPGVSPDDTTATLVIGPAQATRTDANGHVWQFSTTANSFGFVLLRDGAAIGGGATQMGIKTGVIYVQNSSSTNWWKDTTGVGSCCSWVPSPSPF